MKKRPALSTKGFDPENFIQGASTNATDRPERPARRRSSNARPAADGHFRTTFDLPLPLYEELREQAFRSKEPMRDIVVRALESHLGQ